MLGRAKIDGSRSVAVMLVLSVAFAIGCSGKSDSDGDDDDGTSGTGGAGLGGTGGSATGGTSAADGVCLNVCQRVQMCPDANPVDCATDCRDLEDEAAELGCMTAFGNFLACWASASDVCDIETSNCDAVITTYVNCLDGTGGGGGTGSCMPGSVPVNTSCASLCGRLDACPDASPTCATDCADESADAAGTGCATEYQAFAGCASTCADICSLSEDDCTAEGYAYLICFTDYCSANPNAEPCI